MPATPIYALRYPASSDPADVPLDMQELATDVEAAFGRRELGYAQSTAIINPVTATTEAAAQTVVALPAITFDGSACYFEFLVPRVSLSNVSQSGVRFILQDGATVVESFAADFGNNAAAVLRFGPILGRRKLTPSAGSHTYSLRVWAWGGGTSSSIDCGTGGSTFPPAFLRAERA